jgi:hypothetical protein
LSVSDIVKWDKANQILFWYPDKNQETNMIIFGIKKDLDIDQLPNRIALTKTRNYNTKRTKILAHKSIKAHVFIHA